jgi:hypothetical protein
MNNVMIDLETLGNRAGCRILSIGAVEFGASGLGREIYITLSPIGQESLREDASTLEWWKRQAPEARRALDEYAASEAPLSEGLAQLRDFLAPCGLDAVKVWGNGADFDNSILYAAFAAAEMDTPWAFWNSRCFRTLKNLAPGVAAGARTGAHNALADAKFQAQHAVRILASFNGAGI